MTESDWLAQIEADPEDVATQLAYADWLRDRGEDALANAWEWMARRGRWPADSAFREKSWTWFNANRYTTNEPDDLPKEVFAALLDFKAEASDWWKKYASLQDAVAALAVALTELEVTR